MHPARTALLVAHGAPSNPAPQEAWIQALAARTRLWCPGWHIRGTTLAQPGALEQAVAADPRALVYPFFMAEGWFTRKHLPARLAEAGMERPRQLAAFGHTPGITDLLIRAAKEGADAHGLPHRATIVLAAHGSRGSRASMRRTEEVAAILRQDTAFTIVTGYIEEAPFLADVARIRGPALCLPFFATRAGHVTTDIPAALAEAGFTGPLLPAIGEHRDTARLIAAQLDRYFAAEAAPA